jgi:hypothetical protein
VRESYVKLDISAVQAGATVRLRLFGKLSDTRAASVTTSVFPVANTSWAETSVTWNTKPTIPAGTAALDTVSVSGTAGVWVEADITNYAQSQRAASQTTITVMLKNAADTLPYVTFGSRESGNAPRLVIGGGTASNGAARILADSFVRGGSFAGTNYGPATELVAKQSVDLGYHREIFMKLDLTDVTADSDVTLRLFGRLSDARTASVTTNLYPVDNLAWSEGGLTFNNRPTSAASPEASVVVSGTSTQQYDIDLTELAQQYRLAGHSTLGIALKNQAESLPYVGFWSRESEFKPELIVQ